MRIFQDYMFIIKYEQLQVVTMLALHCDKQRRKAFISMQFCYQNWLFLTTSIKSIN